MNVNEPLLKNMILFQIFQISEIVNNKCCVYHKTYTNNPFSSFLENSIIEKSS